MCQLMRQALLWSHAVNHQAIASVVLSRRYLWLLGTRNTQRVAAGPAGVSGKL